MKQYSFLTESVEYQHRFSVGDKIRVKRGMRCIHGGKEGTVLKIEKDPKYGYDLLICKLHDGTVIGMNDGSFEKL